MKYMNACAVPAWLAFVLTVSGCDVIDALKEASPSQTEREAIRHSSLPLTRLSEDATSFQLSQDGRYVVFRSDSVNPQTDERKTTWYSFDLQTAKKRELAHAFDQESRYLISTDSKHVYLFTGPYIHGIPIYFEDLKRIALDGSETRSIQLNALMLCVDFCFTQPDEDIWSRFMETPDGRGFYYVGGDGYPGPDKPYRVFRVNWVTGKSTTLSPPFPIYSDHSYLRTAFQSISSEGATFLTVKDSKTSLILIKRKDGALISLDTQELSTWISATDHDIAGAVIAAHLNERTNEYWMLSADGRRRRKILGDSTFVLSASRDGRKILYREGRDPVLHRLLTSSGETVEMARLPSDAYDINSISASPDLSLALLEIAPWNDRGDSTVLAINQVTGKTHSFGPLMRQPTFSPDRRHFFMLQVQPGVAYSPFTLFLCETSTLSCHKADAEGDRVRSAYFTPDSSRIIYHASSKSDPLASDPDGGRVFSLKISDGSSREVTPNPAETDGQYGSTRSAVTADGSNLVFLWNKKDQWKPKKALFVRGLPAQ